jgi:hypothetical protein
MNVKVTDPPASSRQLLTFIDGGRCTQYCFACVDGKVEILSCVGKRGYKKTRGQPSTCDKDEKI